MNSNARPRSIRLARLILVTLLALVPVAARGQGDRPPDDSPATASSAGIRVLDLVVREDTFDLICDGLDLTEDQRAIARLLHADYLDRVRTLDAEARRINDEGHDRISPVAMAFHRRLREYLAGGGSSDSEWVEQQERKREEEIRAIRDEMHAEKVRVKRRGDEPIVGFIADLGDLLREDQRAALDNVDRLIRRVELLRPRGRPAPGTTVAYSFEARVDLTRVVEAAREGGGELERLPDPAMAQVTQVLAEWERYVDLILVDELRDSRRLPLRSGDWIVEDGERQDYLKEWYHWYAAVRPFAQRIEAIAAVEIGPDAAEAFDERSKRVVAPLLYDRRWFDVLMEDWLPTRDDLDAGTVEALERFYDEHVRRRRELRDRAFDAGLDARRLHGFLRGDEPAHRRFAEAIRALRDLHEEHFRRLDRHLTDAQVQAFRARITDDRGNLIQHLFGPSL